MAGRRKDAMRSQRRRRSCVMSEGCASARECTLRCISEPRGLSDNVFVPTSRLKEAVMYAVVRSYSGQGASELFDQLEQRNEEVKDLIGGVPGFVSYTAFRSGEGGLTVTVCQDKTGTDESSRRAAEWVKENIGATADPPAITEGGTVVHFSS